jgi:hypothetical protein
VSVRRWFRLVPLSLALQAFWPGVGRADEPGVATLRPDEPAVSSGAKARGASTPRSFWAPLDRGPRLKFGYRTFSVTDMGEVEARYHCFAIDAYVYSGIVRAGLGVEGGADSTPRSNFILDGTVNVGVQYPMRITPFFETTVGFGFLRRDVLHEDLFGFIYHVGLEAGAEVFISTRFLLSTAVGWRRQVFRYGENPDVEATYVYFDSFTVKVGLGF